jgi:hypothetical protein
MRARHGRLKCRRRGDKFPRRDFRISAIYRNGVVRKEVSNSRFAPVSTDAAEDLHESAFRVPGQVETELCAERDNCRYSSETAYTLTSLSSLRVRSYVHRVSLPAMKQGYAEARHGKLGLIGRVWRITIRRCAFFPPKFTAKLWEHLGSGERRSLKLEISTAAITVRKTSRKSSI